MGQTARGCYGDVQMSTELIREMVEALETCKSTPLNMVGSIDDGTYNPKIGGEE